MIKGTLCVCMCVCVYVCVKPFAQYELCFSELETGKAPIKTLALTFEKNDEEKEFASTLVTRDINRRFMFVAYLTLFTMFAFISFEHNLPRWAYITIFTSIPINGVVAFFALHMKYARLMIGTQVIAVFIALLDVVTGTTHNDLATAKLVLMFALVSSSSGLMFRHSALV